MSLNIEIKARCRDYQKQLALAADLADSGPQLIQQRDTFFVVPQGRLKLRDFGDGRGELIQYDRPDQAGPKQSRYILIPTDDPEGMRRALAAALSIRGEVIKRRRLYLIGNTRIHFDQVEGLGDFIELEAVVGPEQSAQAAQQSAEYLMKQLEIQPTDLIDAAYIDLLECGS
jgi:predicted adenylyl cyclase CyaB